MSPAWLWFLRFKVEHRSQNDTLCGDLSLALGRALPAGNDIGPATVPAMIPNSVRLDELRRGMADHWSERSPAEIANRVAGPLYGKVGEWDLPSDVTPKRDLISLSVGIPDGDSLPKIELADGLASELAKPGDVALRYGFGLGPPAIREWLAARRAGLEGCDISAEWFQLTNGSSGAIDLVVRSLIDPGDVIIAESPTYMGTLSNFRGVQAEIRFVPVDAHGIDVDALAVLLDDIAAEGKRVKLIYTISAFQNPSGATLSMERRVRLLELARQHDALVLDDEAYRELWFDEPPPPAISVLAGGWGVITVGTFSKTVATGLRVGWVHARPELIDLFERMRFAMGQNQLGLRGFGTFLADGSFEPHLEKMRGIYRHKRDVIHEALRAEVGDYLEWERPDGGFYLWVGLAEGLDETAVWRTAVEEGLSVNRGSLFMSGDAPSGGRLRIAYPWTPIGELPEAARRLRVACERVLAGDAA